MTTNAIPLRCNASQSAEQSPALEAGKVYLQSMPFLRTTADFLLMLLGTMSGGLMGHLLQRSQVFALSTQQLFFGSVAYSAIVICLLSAGSGYRRVGTLLHVKDTEAVLRVSLKAILISLALCIVARYPVPRMTILGAWVTGTLFLAVGRVWFQEGIRKHLASTFPKRRSLIYGTKRTARRFFTSALHSPMLGIDPVGFVGGACETADAIYSNDYSERDARPVFQESLSVEMLKALGIQDIFVCDPEISEHCLKGVREIAQLANCSISLVDNHEILADSMPTWVWEMDGLLVATADCNESGRSYHLTKRFLDIACSAILIVVSAPIWLLVAIAIRLESVGPVFFRQTRVGQNGKLFQMLKFRSMKVDAPKNSRSPDLPTDIRITLVGRYLRKTSLDEVPQLINVLKGDMSLVGPRPEMPFITADYGPWEATRLIVPQGMTGFWQLSADRRYAIHQSIEYDLYYIRNRTLLIDVAILLHTLVYAAKGI
jgi:exopolysaccharide biosynthesis polyprenyl glycosylphosphotransferase